MMTTGTPRRWSAVLLLLVISVCAFLPAWKAPLDFDDIAAVMDNPYIKTAWPPIALVEWPAAGTALSGRPISNYSFAINNSVTRAFARDSRGDSQTPVIAYHVTNIALHALNAVLLFAFLGITLESTRLPSVVTDQRPSVALFAAALWAVHPLQTEAVNYVVQRTELLAALFILGSLTAAALAERERLRSRNPTPRRLWTVVAVLAAGLGVASKEVAVVIPLLLVLYDRAFLYQSWREGWRTRRWLYGGLFATWIPLLVLVSSGARGATVGKGPISSLEYLLSQGWAISQYAKLFILPGALTFDYGPRPIPFHATLFPSLVVIAALVGTVWCWVRPRLMWLGFVGAWWFVLLAPSSSIIPIQTEIAAERRAYLASVALAVVVVGLWLRYAGGGRVAASTPVPASKRNAMLAAASVALAYCWAAQSALGLLAVSTTWVRILASAALGTVMGLVVLRLITRPSRASSTWPLVLAGCVLLGLSAYRGSLYNDPRVRWQHGIEETPNNPRAYQNLAGAMLRRRPPMLASADSVIAAGLRVDSSFFPLYLQAADIAVAENRLADADTLIGRVLQLHPGDLAATEKRGRVLLASRRPGEAIPLLAAVAQARGDIETLSLLALANLMAHRTDTAIVVLQRALSLDSARGDLRHYMGAALVEVGRGREAVAHLRSALQLEGNQAQTLGLMGLAFAQAEETDSASHYVMLATDAAPNDAATFLLAGRALFELRRFADAAELFEHAVRLHPSDPQALTRLAMAAEAMDFRLNATKFYRAALAIDPNYSLASAGLARLAGRDRKGAER